MANTDNKAAERKLDCVLKEEIKMKTYRISYRETLEKDFYVEANDPEDAVNKLNQMNSRGELDFSDMYLDDSGIYNVEED